MIAADGTIVWLADFVTMVETEGEPMQLRGVMVDITERKKAEEALVAERKLLRVLIDNLPDYIYVKDEQLRHIINNRANVQLLGFQTEEETINKNIVELLGDRPGKISWRTTGMYWHQGCPLLKEKNRSGIKRANFAGC
jgi:PAS domain-containing protein